MLRKILISLAGIAFASAFLACQTDEDVTGPITLNDGDEPIVVEGYVKYWPGGGRAPYAFVEAWDETAGGPRFWSQYADGEGYYHIKQNYLKYNEGHEIRLEATKDNAWGVTWFTYSPGPPGPQWVDIYIE